jgi:ribosomal protein S18 acetylase RimI-like enzyme
MQKYQIEIRNSDIETIVMLSNKIPEFVNPHPKEVYIERLKGNEHLILVAYIDNRPAGFKVGYGKTDHFYSWMGAVLPEFRKKGVAKALADYQEAFAIKQGYEEIRFKTRNGFTNMLHFGLQRGFMIIDVDERERVEEHRILLAKKVKGTQ